MSSVKTFVNFENKYDRVIVLVDMDCFYCQVEEKLNPELKGKPIAVVQYNEWKGGGIIAVNYPARSAGVTRHMRGDTAKEHCPEIILCKVPNVRGKADLTKYRDAGKEVAQVLQTFTPLVERASVDEAYLDITDTVHIKLKEMHAGNFKLDAGKFGATHAIGYDSMGNFVQDLTNRSASTSQDEVSVFENESEYEKNAFKRSDLKLLIGAALVNDIRAAVKEKTGYECSAGIAHNKILAKLTAGMHKPNQQTVLPVRSIPELYATLPITKVKGLGGKFGEEVCESLKIKLMSQLATIPKETLLKRFDEKNGNWLYLISRGVDLEQVQCKYNSKSIACCKRFPGKSAIIGLASLNHWLLELATEICERMEKDTLENNRKAKQMTVSYTQTINSEDIPSSRTAPLNYYESQQIAKEALEVIKRNTSQFFKSDNPGKLNNHIKFLGISVSKFEDQTKSDTLKQMFKNHVKKANVPTMSKNTESNMSEDDTAGQSSKTTLAEIMARKKRSVSIDSKDTQEPQSSAVPIRKSSSLLESMFAKQQNRKIQLNEIVVEESQTSKFPKNEDITNTDEETADEETTNDPSIFNNSSTSKVPELDNQTPLCEPSTSSVAEDDEEDIILPEIEVPLIQCPICKRKIPEDEMAAHNDYHFALQLSQQQRQEFRNEMKTKFSPQPNKTNNAKIKVPNKFNKSSSLSSIQSFLKKKEDVTDLGEDAVKCEECGKMVKDIVEHSDYHLAKKLQQELSRSSLPASQTATSTTSKRKRSNSRSDKTNPVKIKPLTTFFSKAE